MSGSISNIGPKRYLVQYDVLPQGNRRRDRRTKILEGVTKKEAEAFVAERRAELLSARSAQANGIRPKDEFIMSELFAGFMESKTTKAATTTQRYDSLIRLYLIPRFGDKRAGSLQPHHLTDAYAEWGRKGRAGRAVSAKTIRHVHETFRNVLNWGLRREMLTRNVAALVSKDDLPKAIKPRPKALTETELRKLLQEAKTPTSRAKKRGYLSSQPWFYPAVCFSAYTGARRGEVLAMRWSDIDFDQAKATISRSLTENLDFKAPKNDRAREIVMPPLLVEVLKEHRDAQDAEKRLLGAAYQDQGLVFARADGSVVDPWNYGRAVSDLVRRAGVKSITLHGLRDTHASLLAQAGVPIEVVSKRLGHSDIGVTYSRYIDVYTDRDADAAARFGKLVG